MFRPTLNNYEKQKNIIVDHVSVQAGDANVIQKLVAEQEKIYKKFLSDSAFQKILLFLRIMINRNQAGEFLEEQEEIDSENYLFALDILNIYHNIVMLRLHRMISDISADF